MKCWPRFVTRSGGSSVLAKEPREAAGITAQQHQALLAIKGFPARDKITVGELAERLQAPPPQRGWID